MSANRAERRAAAADLAKDIKRHKRRVLGGDMKEALAQMEELLDTFRDTFTSIRDACPEKLQGDLALQQASMLGAFCSLYADAILASIPEDALRRLPNGKVVPLRGFAKDVIERGVVVWRDRLLDRFDGTTQIYVPGPSSLS